jgi:hypothetical protein
MTRCDDCRATLAWVRETRVALRDSNGLAAPSAWASIEARLIAGDAVLLPSADAPARASQQRSGLKVAAGVLLLVCAGAVSAVVPGSPVRAWIASLTSAMSGPRVAPVVPPDSTRGAAAETVTTLIVPAVNGAVRVDIEAPDAGLELRVRVSETSELEVQASGAAAAARFRSGSGRLTIAQPGAGRIVLVLPRSVGLVTVRVDGTSYLVKERDQLRVLAPLADTAGSEIILRLRP